MASSPSPVSVPSPGHNSSASVNPPRPDCRYVEWMSDEHILREKVRGVIQAGMLPTRRPDRVWGGPGVGADCTICGTPVRRDENEFEIEFVRDGDGTEPATYHLHIECFAAWEQLQANLEPSRTPHPKGKGAPSAGAVS
jgi:hypothetical protein